MNGQLTASCGQTKIFSFEFAILKAVSMPEGLFLHRNSCFVLAVEAWTRDCVFFWLWPTAVWQTQKDRNTFFQFPLLWAAFARFHTKLAFWVKLQKGDGENFACHMRMQATGWHLQFAVTACKT